MGTTTTGARESSGVPDVTADGGRVSLMTEAIPQLQYSKKGDPLATARDTTHGFNGVPWVELVKNGI
jgi:hypothetical protein